MCVCVCGLLTQVRPRRVNFSFFVSSIPSLILALICRTNSLLSTCCSLSNGLVSERVLVAAFCSRLLATTRCNTHSAVTTNAVHMCSTHPCVRYTYCHCKVYKVEYWEQYSFHQTYLGGVCVCVCVCELCGTHIIAYSHHHQKPLQSPRQL